MCFTDVIVTVIHAFVNIVVNIVMNIVLMLLQSKHFKGLLVNCRARLYFVNVDYNKKVSSINRFELLDLAPPGA